MESSRWFEAVTHPISGKRTTLYADTEVLLAGKIAAWHSEFGGLPATDPANGPARRE